MLFHKRHGHQVQPAGSYDNDDADKGSFKKTKAQTMADVCGFSDAKTCPDAHSLAIETFGYFFEDADDSPHSSDTTAALDELANAMIDQLPPENGNSDVPAIITYLGQFIDHDITAGTDTEHEASSIDIPDVVPLPRDKVKCLIANMRTGALDLDSVYGGAAVQGSFAAKMRGLMRSPTSPAKMFLGTTQDLGGPGVRPELPKDPAADLLRLGRFFGEREPKLDKGFVETIPEGLRDLFTREKFESETDERELNFARAIIGDARNDENLGVASVHLSFLRLHNRIVDHAHKFGGPTDDDEALFNWARDRVRWIYQWLIINVYLPSICSANVLDDVIKTAAPVYKGFFEAHHGDGSSLMPIPFEFSVAAFRFGHTTARADYDWNRHFGRPDGEGKTFLKRAEFDLMFAFTGDGQMRPPHRPSSDKPDQKNPFPPGSKLPENWIVDMERFLNVGGEFDDRNTRRVDTHLAPPLHDMINIAAPTRDPDDVRKATAEHQKMVHMLKVLPRRNLRRGQRLNLATGQECHKALESKGVRLTRMTSEQISGGSTGAIARKHGFHQDTPLWFYVLKEAETLGKGLRLGPLGSRIVAEVLVGLVVNGPNTYWAQTGSDEGRWHPRDDVKPDGHTVDSLEGLMRAALLLGDQA
ncbi:MAG: peroxidase family protein [Nereida ignava]